MKAGAGLAWALLAFLAAPNAVAQECPNPAKLKNLCMMVSERVKEKDPAATHRYRYRTQILAASCVEPGDSKAAMRAKVDAMWRQNQSRLICNSLQFDMQNGSVLKFALNQYFDAFLDDAIELGVPLNLVDAADGKTVLDYVRDKIERNAGKQTEKIFQAYYERLRKAGAKHRAEL
jgi:hypothetical protein